MDDQAYTKFRNVLIQVTERFLIGTETSDVLLFMLDMIPHLLPNPAQLEDIKQIVTQHTHLNLTVPIKLAQSGSTEDFQRAMPYLQNLAAPRPSGESTVHTALLCENFQLVQWLVDHGVDPDIPNPITKLTPLMLAVRESKSRAAAFMIDHYAERINFEAVDAHNNTLLRRLVTTGSPETFERCLQLEYFKSRLDSVRAEIETYEAEQLSSGAFLGKLDQKRNCLFEAEKRQLAEQSPANPCPKPSPRI